MLCSIENQNDLPSLKYSEDKNQESDLQCGDDQYEENDDERTSATPEEKRPKKKGGLSNKGRQLFCRKCEGHGTQVSLKGHTALCPYVNCQCKSCERLMRMRKSAFIRRYRTALSTTDPNEVNIKPIRLFENTNPRFAVAPPKEESNSAPHSETEEAQPFSFSNPSQLNLKFASTDQPSDTFPSSTNNNDKASSSQVPTTCISPRRDLAVGRVPFPVKSGMAPTVGSTVGPVMNANGVVPGPQNLLNQFSNNMISELPANSAQREILNSMLQAQNFNSSTLDAQQLAHIHALQQQSFYAQQQATLASQNRINQNGAISPPKVQPPMSIQNQIGLRQKRPSQAETFPVNHEPMNKRAVGSSFPQGGNFPLQQLSSMTNSQQMAILQQMQQQNLPTSASMQMPAVGPRPPQTRLPFPAQGFPSFNPTGAVLSQGDEGLQNYIRNMQMSGMIPQRPQADLSQLMAMMAAGNQPRTSMSFDDLKRKEILPQIPGLDQNSLAQQLALRSAEEIRLIQLRNSPQQMAFAAMAQQNDQRRRSLPLVQPNPLGLSLLNPQFQTQSSLLTTTASENTSQASGTQVSSPVKEIQSTPSVSSASPNQTSNGNKNGIESHSPSHLGPDEMRYQMFLHSINLFNKKVIEENDGAILSERLEIPPPVVEAARYTHLAKIQVPNPSVSLDEIQPGWRGKLEGSSKIAQTEIPSTTT